MALAVLSIDLEARLAKFEGDLGRASRSLDKLATSAKASFAGVGSVFAGSLLAGAAQQSIQSMVSLFPRLIDGVAAFQTLSEQTGASATGLASFQLAADLSGVSVDTMAGLMVKLTGNLSKLTDESKGSALALRNLGIPLEEFRKLRPDKQIRLLSERFNSFADGAGKTSNALALFGRQGAQILNFFKDYGDGLDQTSRLTEEQIAQADLYTKAHARLRNELKATAQVLAVQALPAITALGEGFSTGLQNLLGLKRGVSELRAETAILDFAESGALAVGTLAEALIGVGKTINAVSGSFGVVATDVATLKAIFTATASEQVEFVAKGTGPLAAVFDKRNKVVAEASQRYTDLLTYNGTAVTDALRKSFAAQRVVMDKQAQAEAQRFAERARTIAGAKPELATVVVADEDQKKADAAFQRFLAQIKQRQVLAQSELDTNEKVADSERFRIDIMSRLGEAEDKLNPKQRARIVAALEEAAAVIEMVEAQREMTKARAGAQAITDRQLQGLDRETQARIDSNAALRRQVEEIGLSAEALDQLTIARLENRAATEAQTITTMRDADADAIAIAIAERNLDLLRQEIALRGQSQTTIRAQARDATKGAGDALDEYFSRIKEGGVATKQAVGQTLGLLEDDLTTSLASGSFSVRRTVDLMIAEFLRLQVVRPLLQSLFSSIGSGNAVTAFAKLFGFAKGGAFDGSGVVPFASGGVFDGPQLFRFARGGAMATGVLGEAGPEAIMPLQRGRGGKLGVRAEGVGGSRINIVQHLTFGSNVSRNEMFAYGQAIKAQTLAAVADSQRRRYAGGTA